MVLLNQKIRLPFGGRRRIKLWLLLSIITFLFIITIRRSVFGYISLEEYSKLTYPDKYNSKYLKQLPMTKRPISSHRDHVFQSGCRDVQVEMKYPRANAALVVLSRNFELDGVMSSMRSLERHFNQWFNYPWVFLNNEEFSDNFKEQVSAIASGNVEFGIIPPEHWNFAEEESNPELFRAALDSQKVRGIRNGDIPSYHKMCRFFSSYFYEHELVQKYDWYWRVEPHVQFFCDLTYDPFIELKDSGKVYGFTVMIKELPNTIPNFFRHTKAFIKENNILLHDSWKLFVDDFNFYKGRNEMKYSKVRDKNGFWKTLKERTPINHALKKDSNSSEEEAETLDSNSIKLLTKHSSEQGLLSPGEITIDKSEYNLCHFWSNFEIARTDLFSSPSYQAYFKYLDASKGFFTERWGDAPVHSLAAAMFLNLSQIHYFRDIGYQHTTIRHCPANSPNQLPYQSSLGYRELYTKEEETVFAHYDKPIDNENVGTGCRCRCPKDSIKDIENVEGTCTDVWARVIDNERPDDKFLDLDFIEDKTVEMYRDYLKNNNGNGKGWKLSHRDTRMLEELVL